MVPAVLLVLLMQPLFSQTFQGFFNFEYLPDSGIIYLEVDHLNQEFLYVTSLAAGVGSNDIGLDRGQIGGEHVVQFEKYGNKLLLVKQNYRYRAESENAYEERAVRDAFARSVLWGFPIQIRNGKEYIELTSFLLRDAHGVSATLKDKKQGNYQIDPVRSVIFPDNTMNFPENSEFEAIVTYSGKPEGGWIRSVTPEPEAISVRIHHSFIALPGAPYKPRAFDPRSGFISLSYYDYATPVTEPLEKRVIIRHRLEKKFPDRAQSEPVEPIVYYLDPGCPEPIRSALMQGASWWNEAFAYAGYIDAFRVEMLPEGVHPMDVRYNMIHWVHRSTRGWSYGGAITDPRTGEILKGNVLLGSLRVRQDYLIAQGLSSIFTEGDEDTTRLLEMALARLRQLAAHEVGHTLGLTHNFAASHNDRSSVMDYPHPYILLDKDGALDFSKAYDTGIGEWDKRAILYGYQDFPAGEREGAQLGVIIQETIDSGLRFISDKDARPQGGKHPYAHLWDNGVDPVAELDRIIALRKYGLERFGAQTIPTGTPYGKLEELVVPLYLMHRYQVEAVSKMIGGIDFNYAMRGDRQHVRRILDRQVQEKALRSILRTLRPDVLAIPEKIIASIPPLPEGYDRTREMFKSANGGFDPFSAAQSCVNHTFQLLLHPQRLQRILEHHVRQPETQFSLPAYLDMMLTSVHSMKANTDYEKALVQIVEREYVYQLIRVSASPETPGQVAAFILYKLKKMGQGYTQSAGRANNANAAHQFHLSHMIDQYLSGNNTFDLPPQKSMPPGSPIGCDGG